MLILRKKGKKIEQERKRKTPSSQGNAQTPETRSKLPPCSISSRPTAKAKNNLSTYRAFHTFLPSANSGARIRETLLAHASSCLWAGYHLKNAWPKSCPLFTDLSNFKMGSFLGILSRQWGGLLNLPLSAWIYPRTSLGLIFSGTCQYYPIRKDIPPIHTKTKGERFYIKGKSKHFQK